MLKKFHKIDKDAQYAVIKVRDKGVGINRDIQDKIFDPFFTTKSKTEGIGLGLNMVYRVVKEHNGFIDFETKVGEGTEFSIYIPTVTDSSQLEPNTNREIHNSKKNIDSDITILIVDDEPLIRKIAERIITSMGYNTIVAEDGGEAIDIFEKRYKEIDCILLDLVMPILSGKETYIKLKEISQDIKVIISSGFRKDERVDEMVELGISGFLQKPYTVNQMKDEISKILD